MSLFSSATSPSTPPSPASPVSPATSTTTTTTTNTVASISSSSLSSLFTLDPHTPSSHFCISDSHDEIEPVTPTKPSSPTGDRGALADEKRARTTTRTRTTTWGFDALRSLVQDAAGGGDPMARAYLRVLGAVPEGGHVLVVGGGLGHGLVGSTEVVVRVQRLLRARNVTLLLLVECESDAAECSRRLTAARLGRAVRVRVGSIETLDTLTSPHRRHYFSAVFFPASLMGRADPRAALRAATDALADRQAGRVHVAHALHTAKASAWREWLAPHILPHIPALALDAARVLYPADLDAALHDADLVPVATHHLDHSDDSEDEQEYSDCEDNEDDECGGQQYQHCPNNVNGSHKPSVCGTRLQRQFAVVDSWGSPSRLRNQYQHQYRTPTTKTKAAQKQRYCLQHPHHHRERETETVLISARSKLYVREEKGTIN